MNNKVLYDTLIDVAEAAKREVSRLEVFMGDSPTARDMVDTVGGLVDSYNRTNDTLYLEFICRWLVAFYQRKTLLNDDIIWRRIIEETKRGAQEHGSTWRTTYEEQAERHFGGSYARLIYYQIDRKLDAYEENGDPQQILEAIVYSLAPWGRHKNLENGDVS